jgi:hypothetical protein
MIRRSMMALVVLWGILAIGLGATVATLARKAAANTRTVHCGGRGRLPCRLLPDGATVVLETGPGEPWRVVHGVAEPAANRVEIRREGAQNTAWLYVLLSEDEPDLVVIEGAGANRAKSASPMPKQQGRRSSPRARAEGG